MNTTAPGSLASLVEEARTATEATSVELALFEAGRSWVVAGAGTDPPTTRLGDVRARFLVEEQALHGRRPARHDDALCIPLLRRDGVAVGGLLLRHAAQEGSDRRTDAVSQVSGITAKLSRALEGDAIRPPGLGAIHNAMRDIVLVVDENATVIHVGGAVTHHLGYARRELLGRSGGSLVHPDDLGAAVAGFGDVAAGREIGRLTARLRHASGFWIPFSFTGSNRLEDPAIGGIVINGRNESFEDVRDDELYQARHLTAALAHHLEDGIVLCDQEGRITLINDTARQLHLTRQGAAPPTHVDDLWFGRSSGARSPVWRSLQCGEAVSVDTDVRAGGTQRIVHLACRPVDDDDGRRIGALMVVRDVSHDRRETEQLRLQAHRDELTGLPNRTIARAVLRGRWARPGEGQRAVLFADVDGLKKVNDRYGHPVGDQLLVDIARRLNAATRSGDLVCRWGGDEFLIVCAPLHHPREADEIASRILDAMSQPLVVGDAVLEPSVSVGVAVVSEAEDTDYEAVVARADNAMYQTKRRRIRR